MKIRFFKDIAKKLNVFLTRFQTNNPNVLNDATTVLKLVKIDMTDKENQLDAVSIKLGTVLKEMLSALGATDTDVKIQNFKKECKNSVIAIAAKLQERSLLQYTVVKIASLISPYNMVRAKEKSLTCFNLLAEKVAKIKMDVSRQS